MMGAEARRGGDVPAARGRDLEVAALDPDHAGPWLGNRQIERSRDATMDSLRGSSVKIGTMQRRLAWPLCKDDTHKSKPGRDEEAGTMATNRGTSPRAPACAGEASASSADAFSMSMCHRTTADSSNSRSNWLNYAEVNMTSVMQS